MKKISQLFNTEERDYEHAFLTALFLLPIRCPYRNLQSVLNIHIGIAAQLSLYKRSLYECQLYAFQQKDVNLFSDLFFSFILSLVSV